MAEVVKDVHSDVIDLGAGIKTDFVDMVWEA